MGIEVKGIGGTSTDNECSQISKIKYRRAAERDAFDVYALYVVNHRRYLPPEERQNPPFSESQIKDALNEGRGLLATYDLFKLYFNIVNNCIKKEDARNALFQHGLVIFQPSDAKKIESPFEIHYNGHVIIFTIDGFEVRKGMNLVLCDSGRCRLTTITEIRINDHSVECASSGEVSIKLSDKVFKSTEIWVRQNI